MLFSSLMPSAHSHMQTSVDWCFRCSTSCWHTWLESVCISVWQQKVTGAPSGAALLADQQYVNMLVSLETARLMILCFQVMSVTIRQSHLHLHPAWPVRVRLFNMYTVLWSDGALGGKVKSIQRGRESPPGCSSECWAEQQKSKAAYANEMSSFAG